MLSGYSAISLVESSLHILYLLLHVPWTNYSATSFPSDIKWALLLREDKTEAIRLEFTGKNTPAFSAPYRPVVLNHGWRQPHGNVWRHSGLSQLRKGVYWHLVVETWGANEHTTMHRTASTAKNYLHRNVTRTKKHYPRQRKEPRLSGRRWSAGLLPPSRGPVWLHRSAAPPPSCFLCIIISTWLHLTRFFLALTNFTEE